MEDKLIFKYKDDTFYIHHTLTLNPDSDVFSFKSHSHNMYEIYVFLKGKAEFAVEGKLYPLTRGSVIVTNRGQTHNILINSPQEPYERIAFLIGTKGIPEGFDEIFKSADKGNNYFQLDDCQLSWFLETVRILSRFKNDKSTMEILVPSAVNCIISTIATMLSKAPEELDTSVDIVEDTVNFINRNLGKEWNMETLEKTLFRDRSYINRKFKSVMGCSVWDYNLRKRIFTAQQKLYLTASVCEAFQSSGFGDYSVFFRNYKKYIGMSPKEDLKGFLDK